MADPKHPHGVDALDDLAARVAMVKKDRDERAPKVTIDRSSMSMGLRMGSEFASAILVGGLLGYGVDFIVKSSPWALLVGLILGLTAGTVNIIRTSRELGASNPVDPHAQAAVIDEDNET